MTDRQNLFSSNVTGKPKNEYVSNEKMYEAIIEYKKQVKNAKEEGKEKPKIPEYLGECILKIADHLGMLAKFHSYSFLDEMKSDGIENVITYFDNFDPNKSRYPFTYFTKIIYYAFTRRIMREKKQTYIKHLIFANDILTDAFLADQINDEAKNDILDSVEKIDFIRQYEARMEEKKEKNLTKKNSKIVLTDEDIIV